MWVYSELILEIVFQIVIIPIIQNEDLNVPGSASLCFEQSRVLTALLFLFLSFLFCAIYFSQSNFFISTFTYQRRTVFLKVEQIFSVSIQTNHCERENLEITPKIIVLLKIQCSKNFLGLTGPSIAFEIISKCSLFTIFLKFMQNNGECPTHICFCLVLVWFCFLNEENCLYL